MKALARRYGRASMAGVKSALERAGKTAREHPYVAAPAIGAVGGLVAGVAGVVPGLVIGASTAIAVVAATSK